MKTLLKYTNKWRDKFLSLVETDNNEFNIILTRIPQTNDFCLCSMDIEHKQNAFNLFNDYRKGHKLTILEVDEVKR